jgi:hypothetical protein
MIRDRALHEWARPGEASEAELRLIAGLLPFGALIAFSRSFPMPDQASDADDDDLSALSGIFPADFGDSRNV